MSPYTADNMIIGAYETETEIIKATEEVKAVFSKHDPFSKQAYHDVSKDFDLVCQKLNDTDAKVIDDCIYFLVRKYSGFGQGGIHLQRIIKKDENIDTLLKKLNKDPPDEFTYFVCYKIKKGQTKIPNSLGKYDYESSYYEAFDNDD